MPKEMFSVQLQRKPGDPWGLVIVGGKDKALTVKLGKVKVFSAADSAGLKQWDYLCSINGKEVFEMSHSHICSMVKNAGISMELVVERGDHIVPNFAELWPHNNPMGKRRQIGIDYYLDALKHNGLTGHLPQPENFTTCGKLGIESNQYNCPIECYDEAVLDEMTEEVQMQTNPILLEAKKEIQSLSGTNTFNPKKSNVLPTLAAEEKWDNRKRTA